MKALMQEIGDHVISCVPTGAIIVMFLALLSAGGAVSDAVLRFAAGIC